MTAYQAVRVTDLAQSQLLAPDSVRQAVRQRLARSIRAVTDAPIRFACLRFAMDLDPREGGGIEYRAFAGDDAVKHVAQIRAARKAGFLL